MLDDIKPHRAARAAKNKEISHPSKLDSKDSKNSVDETIEVPSQDDKVEKKPSDAKGHRKWWHIFSYKHTHLSTRKWALLVVGLLMVLVLASVGSYKLYQHIRKLPLNPKQAAVKKVPVKPTTEPSRLTGLQVDPALNARPVTGVMIENSPDARPQSALKDAGVVFEAIAEGGITRFLALFEDTKPEYIGPVRSIRPYYVDWAMGFDASIAHVGGSPDGLAHLRELGARDLDQFANGGAYTRISTRYAPHNVYTSTANLDALNQSKGFTSSTFTSWNRKKDEKIATLTARTIDLDVSAFLYSPHYEYDMNTSTYKRSEGGQPHLDERSGEQIAPKVVVAMVMQYGIASDGKHSIYNSIGSGHVFIFQDGRVIEGTWQKANAKSQIVFTDSAGASIKLNAGQTWLTMVNSASDVSYKP